MQCARQLEQKGLVIDSKVLVFISLLENMSEQDSAKEVPMEGVLIKRSDLIAVTRPLNSVFFQS